jgi:hypothetical protein
MSQFAPPTTTYVQFTPGAQVYIMSVLIFFLLVYHSFLLMVHFMSFYFFNSARSPWRISSHQNEFTLRDSSDHSNHPSEDNMWSVIDYGDFSMWYDVMTWYVWLWNFCYVCAFVMYVNVSWWCWGLVPRVPRAVGYSSIPSSNKWLGSQILVSDMTLLLLVEVEGPLT